MDFCSNCDNMYYIKLENDECDKIVYYCRNCGNIDDQLINVNKCILRENINKSEDKYNVHINKYTKNVLTNFSFTDKIIIFVLCLQLRKNFILSQEQRGLHRPRNHMLIRGWTLTSLS